MSFVSSLKSFAKTLTRTVAPPPPPPPPPPPAPRERARFAADATDVAGGSRPSRAALPNVCRNHDGHPNEKLMNLAQSTATLDNVWSADRPLSEAHNAHSTNTKEQMEAALEEGHNWLEGDIRTEINSDGLEMRHDGGHESGDNLTLKEWLEIGKESGRGLKLDFKEGDRTLDILDEVEASGMPDERLMFNLGDADMATYGAEIRKRFPEAILAVNPTDKLDGQENDGPLEDWQVDRMIEHAEAFGEPVTFVVRFDRLTDEAIGKLKEHGTVSVWNQMSGPGVDDPEQVAAELRERGVNGVIDIRETPDLSDKAGIVLEKGGNLLRDGWDKVF